MIELYNDSANNLADMSLSDDPGVPRKYVSAKYDAGRGQYLLVMADSVPLPGIAWVFN